MGDVKEFVDNKIKEKRVVMFSKTYCPFCTKAKKAIKPLVGKELPEDEYEVIELENDPRMQKIQEYMKKLTGASSVPRVFINGKFVGGGDEIAALASNGKLKGMVSA